MTLLCRFHRAKFFHSLSMNPMGAFHAHGRKMLVFAAFLENIRMPTIRIGNGPASFLFSDFSHTDKKPGIPSK